MPFQTQEPAPQEVQATERNYGEPSKPSCINRFVGLFAIGIISIVGKVALSAEPAGVKEQSAEIGTVPASKLDRAIFAGGCFWCVQPPFEKLPGVSKVVSGYTGGTGVLPTYEDYAQKGHIEAVEVTYDSSRIAYTQLLEVLWRQINPTDAGGQFVDRGPQYRSAIFYLNDEQKHQAELSKEDLGKTRRFDKPIVTDILKATAFYPAEDYHQDYYKKNPIRTSITGRAPVAMPTLTASGVKKGRSHSPRR